MRRYLLPLLLLLLLVPASAEAGVFQKGSYYQAELRAEKQKCPGNGVCQKKARKRARTKTLRAMKGEKLWGSALRPRDIPARPGTPIWAMRKRDGSLFVLYSSRAYPSGKKTAVSGFVLLPRGRAPRRGWPIISWAHGTTGIADKCAPTRGTDGSYGQAQPLLAHWQSQGYAVVATDYEGLGTPGVHPYLVGESEARGMADIVPAARKLLPALSGDVVMAGHSQGGHAALFASRASLRYPFRLRGTLAYAPPSRLDVQAELIGTQPDDAYGLSALASLILRGATVADRSIDPSEILQPAALPLYNRNLRVCLTELGAEFAAASVGPRELLLPGWQDTVSGVAFERVLGEMNPVFPLREKLLLLQGLDDTTVLPLFTNALSNDLQALSPGLVEYLTYDNWSGSPTSTHQTIEPSTHTSILSDSLDEAKGFLRASFP